MTTIAFFNRKGGVGSTTLAFHTCVRARSRGLRVAAVSTEPRDELRSRLRESRVELTEPGAADLIVADLNSSTQALPWDVDVWVLPIVNRRSYEHACRLSDELAGDVVWMPNLQAALAVSPVRYIVPEYLREEVTILGPIPRSRALAIQEQRRASVWGDSSTKETRAARVLERTIDELLAMANVIALGAQVLPIDEAEELRSMRRSLLENMTDKAVH